MRWWATVILLGVMAAVCGSDTATTSTAPTTTASPSPTTSSKITSTTSTTQPREDLPDLNWVLDRSVLGLALESGEITPGRFRIQRGPNTEFLMTVEGRYWVTDERAVYTVLDIDSELVVAQMGPLAATLEAEGGQLMDSPYLTSRRDHYRGDEFQIRLTDLIRSLAVGVLPAEWAEQWSWFIQAEGNLVPSELLACSDSIASLDQAARQWIHELEIEFTDGTWAFPVDTFERDLAAEIGDASICESFVEVPGPSPESVIGLSGDADLRRIEVLVDDKTYTDRDPELTFAIMMQPDESVGPPPIDWDPASLLTLRDRI